MVVDGQRGFSLIETLVAAVILFSVLTSSFLAFQGSIIGSKKAQTRVELLKTVPQIRAEITRRLQGRGLTSGAGIVDEVHYDWTAEVKAVGFVYDVQSGSGDDLSVPGERRFSLWNVVLEVGVESSEREFVFTELSWSD